MRKIICTSLIVFASFSTLCANANEISKYVHKNSSIVGKNSAIYIYDKTNNKSLYQKNINKSYNPASTLKTLTFGASYKVLGSDYIFETSLYKDNENNYYIKLGGDVLLTQGDLNDLISNLKELEVNNIYIDDSIFEKQNYPSTWLDEDKWPNQRIITPYIIDNNTTKISFNRSSLAKKIDIIQENEYKIPIINELSIGDEQNYKITREYGENSSIINIKGTIKEDKTITLPIIKPEINFNIKLNKALSKNKINYQNIITTKTTPNDAIKIASVGHDINKLSKLILFNSDNFTSEIVFRVAASKYYPDKKNVTLYDAIKMFGEIYAPYLSKEDVIADASGVSKQNLLSAKTMVNILNKLFESENFKNLMPTSNQGTLSNRLNFLKNNLRAKTGTIRNHSSLCGSFTTRKNTNIVFITIIQDSKTRKSLLKNFENTLLGIVYKKY